MVHYANSLTGKLFLAHFIKYEKIGAWQVE